jgi:hypothetical protein
MKLNRHQRRKAARQLKPKSPPNILNPQLDTNTSVSVHEAAVRFYQLPPAKDSEESRRRVAQFKAAMRDLGVTGNTSEDLHCALREHHNLYMAESRWLLAAEVAGEFIAISRSKLADDNDSHSLESLCVDLFYLANALDRLFETNSIAVSALVSVCEEIVDLAFGLAQSEMIGGLEARKIEALARLARAQVMAKEVAAAWCTTFELSNLLAAVDSREFEAKVVLFAVTECVRIFGFTASAQWHQGALTILATCKTVAKANANRPELRHLHQVLWTPTEQLAKHLTRLGEEAVAKRLLSELKGEAAQALFASGGSGAGYQFVKNAMSQKR